ncbi:MAG: hypothetical protein SVM80_07090 [Halobacteriota archaeon]|nr:hypothetical protein [Halobacteriota archaeon]
MEEPKFDIGKDQLKTFSTVIGSMINGADEKDREGLRRYDGREIEINFVDMGSLVIRIRGNKIATYVGESKKPKTLIRINKQPHEIMDVYLPMILDPMKDSLEPIIREGVSVPKVIFLLPKLRTAARVVIGGMFNRNLGIKGSVTTLIPITRVILAGFSVEPEVDSDFVDQRRREREEFLKNMHRNN